MANNSFSESRKSKNKSFIIDNSLLLQEYARENYDFHGSGIIVINLLLLKTENLQELNLLDGNLEQISEPTVHQPISYITKDNFWFKMLNLKIKKKHKIDLQTECNGDEIFIVFIKDDAIEYLSIYKIKIKKHVNR